VTQRNGSLGFVSTVFQPTKKTIGKRSHVLILFKQSSKVVEKFYNFFGGLDLIYVMKLRIFVERHWIMNVRIGFILMDLKRKNEGNYTKRKEKSKTVH